MTEAETIKEGETVEGVVISAAQNEVGDDNNPRFGYRIDPDADDRDPFWVNGWGTVDEGLEGDRVRVTYDVERYKGELQHEVQDKDDIDVVGTTDNGSSGSDGADPQRQKFLNRQSAVKSVATMWRGDPPTDADAYDKFRNQVDDVLSKIETGDWKLPKGGDDDGDDKRPGAERPADDSGQ